MADAPTPTREEETIAKLGARVRRLEAELAYLRHAVRAYLDAPDERTMLDLVGLLRQGDKP